ncbi:MAG: nucleotidyltransferase family protein [Methanobacterium sp.]
MKTVSAIITAAGKNRRMMEDLQSRGMEIRHKLLLELYGEPILNYTIKKALKTSAKWCIVVLGHFQDDLIPIIAEISSKRLKIVENPEIEVELSQTLLNGALNCESDFCLCLAGDQPTITTETMQKLIDAILESHDPKNTVTILARGRTGYLNSTKGLGMPFACHKDLLKKYLAGREDNLNPILKRMMVNKVIFYGIPTESEIELVNINRYDDYLYVKNKLEPPK